MVMMIKAVALLSTLFLLRLLFCGLRLLFCERKAKFRTSICHWPGRGREKADSLVLESDL